MTKIQVSNLDTSAIIALQGPRITTIYVTDNIYNELDDTAVSTDGGYIKILGSNFVSGATVTVGNLPAISTTFVNSTQLRAQIPAQAAGTYPLYVINPDSSVSIILLGVNYSNTPTWSTASTQTLINPIVSFQFSATSNSAVTYSLQAGSTLPPGLSLSSSGLLSGTYSGPNLTVYNFTIVATDGEDQDTPRTFSVTLYSNDFYFKNTSLLIHADGNNLGSNNTFIDTSNSGYSITATGKPGQGTFSPFSQTGWSAYFDGSSLINLSSNASNTIGTQNATIEFWVYPHSSGAGTLRGLIVSHQGGGMFQVTATAANKISIEFNADGGASSSYSSLITTSTLQTNVWTHIAIVRNATQVTCYFNGVADATTLTLAPNTNIGSFNGAKPIYIGSSGDQTSRFTGYISGVRFALTAVYTANFTPPTDVLTPVANTRFIVLQTNSHIDVSGTYTLSTYSYVGTPALTAFSPFAPTIPYSTSTVGGSMYFNGTSDYLNIATANANFGLGTGDWTIEAWVYASIISETRCIIDFRTSGGGITQTRPTICFGTGLNIVYFTAGSNRITSPALTIGGWYHVAVSKNSGTTRMFINGSQVGSNYTDTNDYGATASCVVGTVGDNLGAAYWSGYITNVRVVKGTGVYPGSFSVPTAPLSTTGGTVLLLLGTNASIYDHTGKNILLTYDAVQLQTGQFKYGTSSIFFKQSGGDYITIPQNNYFNFSTGNYTIEAWIRLGLTGTQRAIVDTRGGGGVGVLFYVTSGNVLAAFDGTTTYLTGSTTLSSLTWYHVAITRSGTITALWLNGTAEGIISNDTRNNINGSGGTLIGRQFGSTVNDWYGYMDDIRITKGVARYTLAFTPPTLAFPNQ